MLSNLPEVNQINSSQLPSDSHSLSNHGIHNDSLEQSRQSSHEASAEPPESEAGSAGNSSSSDMFDYDPSSEWYKDRMARLTQIAPGASRITNYENAFTLGTEWRNEGPLFQVIKRAKSGLKNGNETSVLQFPNGMWLSLLQVHRDQSNSPMAEVLTHILSHLPPTSLSSMALVCSRFRELVTSPHAWRSAFSRFFPGPASLALESSSRQTKNQPHATTSETENLRSEKRIFTRLTALGSWRSEFMIRTRLLRSLKRGKPPKPLGSQNSSSGFRRYLNGINTVATYDSGLTCLADHLDGSFGTVLDPRPPHFMHGGSEEGMATRTNYRSCNLDFWRSCRWRVFQQFSDVFPGHAQWGLGAGDEVGIPNVLDISSRFGAVYGEGFPDGITWFRSSDDEHPGMFLQSSGAANSQTDLSAPQFGIPFISSSTNSATCVWIAKMPSLPSMTNDILGLATGTSSGVVTFFSLGLTSLSNSRLQRGEISARWVLSPGVPIIALAFDESFSKKRLGQKRIWAVALNALGEVFYLTEIPLRSPNPQDYQHTSKHEAIEHAAWDTGRSVYWTLIEATRRVPHVDPYSASNEEAKHNPRSSCFKMHLDETQYAAEANEMEELMAKKPIYFRTHCEGWDMRRKLLVDFAGDDQNGAGEAIVVVECAIGANVAPRIHRYLRNRVCKQQDASGSPPVRPVDSSLFSGPNSSEEQTTPDQRRLSQSLFSPSGDQLCQESSDVWCLSEFSFFDIKPGEITAVAIDNSNYALLTMAEDPLLVMNGASSSSSSSSSTNSTPNRNGSNRSPGLYNLPGHRGRFIAAGTSDGAIFVWNIRSPVSDNPQLTNILPPIRIIHTESPVITAVALTAFYLVHGGNDGLVQAWDPLASEIEPIRTINSRFSSRARSRISDSNQYQPKNEADMYAAGAICLDPDPTMLQGIVSLGMSVRYWGFSSAATDEYASKKRRLRKLDRSANDESPPVLGKASAGAMKLKNTAKWEHREFEVEKFELKKENDRLDKRFGVGRFGDSEEEALAYAQMLSQEAFRKDQSVRKGKERFNELDSLPEDMSTANDSTWNSIANDDNGDDPDLAQAIRLSLESEALDNATDEDTSFSNSSSSQQIPIRYVRSRRGPLANAALSCSTSGEADLDYALRISLAEDASRKTAQEDEFPPLAKSAGPKEKRRGKGNGKGQAS
ncbi:MAG: hypothetical protein M1829_004918 [Trizodia sp. TS-e1964]|nr:MAG: hypothetical protein M1829_004918 [Trizodia sp. TS-e1964]